MCVYVYAVVAFSNGDETQFPHLTRNTADNNDAITNKCIWKTESSICAVLQKKNVWRMACGDEVASNEKQEKKFGERWPKSVCLASL